MEFSSFIGKSCTVLSKQNVRYSGTLLHIDPAAQKIQVTNVRSYGTENRPAPVFIPPLDQLFGLIEFHVNDLQDLKFDEPVKPAVPPQNVPQPPVPAAAAQMQPPPVPDLASQQQQILPPQSQGQPQPPALQPPAPQSFSAEKAKPVGWENYNAPVTAAAQPPINMVPTPKQANADSLQRAMGAMKISQGPVTRSNGNSPAPAGYGGPGGPGGPGGRGGPRRGRGGRGFGAYHQTPHHDIKVPTSDFDFEASNNLFDKAAAAKHVQLLHGPSNAAATSNSTSPTAGDAMNSIASVNGTNNNPKEEGEISESNTPKENGDGAKTEKAYNPSKSFFDNISSDAKKLPFQRGTSGPQVDGEPTNRTEGQGRGRGRGGGRGRARRDEERDRNVETFGEPGGIGMLGPGAYVGGYGGYRGKRRRGRGGHRGGAGGAPRVAVHDG